VIKLIHSFVSFHVSSRKKACFNNCFANEKVKKGNSYNSTNIISYGILIYENKIVFNPVQLFPVLSK